ncbi:uncharacterized protein LOC116193183 [Punica granatum]|uniref:Uncharacterized protein n=2 Tax=Punica granatum TaxID=22663 RepID=A0A2I0KD96_PUNGR|nr:uncharacterized protein LOC116193183 [Punica granatum]PKI65736.1 hypothetical protein CRG98_013883 [Punica granatum]
MSSLLLHDSAIVYKSDISKHEIQSTPYCPIWSFFAMGSESNLGRGRHYDINMSRRTRKSMLNLHVTPQIPETDVSIEEFQQLIPNEEGRESHSLSGDCEDSADRKSLKELINGDASVAKMEPEDHDEPRGRSSLSQHFTEEEKQLQLQLVRSKQGQDHGGDGLRLKGMVSRCAKVLSHLIKHRGNRRPIIGSSKKLVLRLPDPN